MKAVALLLYFAFLLYVPVETRGAYYFAVGASGPSPILWLKLNDGSGTSAADSSGGSNTGTLTGTSTWGTGPNSNGDLVFDGTGDYVTVANETNFDFERTHAFSVTAWIKVNALASGGNKTVFTKNATSGNFQGYFIQANADNTLVSFTILDSSGASLSTNSGAGTILPNVWYFIAATYAGGSAGSGLKLYVNAGTASTGSGTISNSILNDVAPYVSYGNSLAGDFYGEIDDVRVYDIELTSGQISTLNTAGAQ